MEQNHIRVQLYSHPELDNLLKEQLAAMFPGVEFTLTNQTILADQDLYLVSTTQYFRLAYSGKKEEIEKFRDPKMINKTVFLKSSDLEWPELGEKVIHKRNIASINEMIHELVLS